MNQIPVALSQLVTLVKAQLIGDPNILIHGVATLTSATPGTVSFLSHGAYRKLLANTQASAVVLTQEEASGYTGVAIVSSNPRVTFYQIAAYFHPKPVRKPGIHPTAVIGHNAHIPSSVYIGPYVCIGDGVILGEEVVIEANVNIGEGCVIGSNSTIYPNVVIYPKVCIGVEVTIHSGAVVGREGFGFIPNAQGHWTKVPQVGGVRIGDGCEIGANTTIDRGALDDTVLEEGVILDNQIQVGHNVHIGAHTAIAGCTGISGSARIGRHCLIGGATGISGHIEIADKVQISGMGMVTRSIHEAGYYSSGIPVSENRQWLKNTARFQQLDELARRLKSLEKVLEKQLLNQEES